MEFKSREDVYADKGEHIMKAEETITLDPLQSTNEPYISKEVISIQPGDVIVMTLPSEMTSDLRHAITIRLDRMFPNTESIVLGGSETLEVYREQEKV